MTPTPHSLASTDRRARRRLGVALVVALVVVGLCLPGIAAGQADQPTPSEGTKSDTQDRPRPEVNFVDEDGDNKTTVNTNGSNTDARLSITTRHPHTPVTVRSDQLTAPQLFRIFAGRSPSGVPRDAVPGNIEDATTVNGVAMFDSSVDGAEAKIVIVDPAAYDGSTVTFEETSAADYTFEFATLGATDGVAATERISVVEDPSSATFGDQLYETTAGDLVTVTVSFENTDAGYVMIGGDERTSGTGLRNYIDVLYVENGATFTINTRLVGTDMPSEAVYRPESGTVVSYAQTYGATTDPDATTEFQDLSFESQNGSEVAGTLAEFREHVGIGEIPRPLQPARYRLVAGAGGDIVVRDDGVPDFRYSLARSNLRLTQPEMGTATTYVAPSQNADEVAGTGTLPSSAVEASNVTMGDRLVVEFGGNGTMGALTHVAGDQETATAAELEHLLGVRRLQEGVNLTITEVDPGVNEEPNRVDFQTAAPQDVVLLTEAGPENKRIDRFYLVIDTRYRRPFREQPEPGDRFRVEFTYELPPGERYRFAETGPGTRPPAFDPANEPADDGTEHFPYVTEEATATTTFTFQKPRVRYDQVSRQGRLVLEPQGGTQLTGTTNLAPGTPYWIRVVAGEQRPARTISVTQGTVGSDGAFGTTVDLATLDAGETIDVEFYTTKPTASDADQRLLDERRGVTVADSSAPADFEITSMTTEATVTEGESLSNFTATIRNNGSVEGQQNVTLSIENETVASQVELLRTDESVTYTYGTVYPDREPGSYNVTLRTGTDSAEGALLVESAQTPTSTPVPDPTPTPTADATATSTPSTTQDQTVTPTPVPTTGTPTTSGEPPSNESDQNALPVPPLGPQRTRDALSATAIVGGAYLVDYFL
ncbi:COG1361 family protein [Haloarcula halophila]|uniref:CARDB domain-containing protein n=1 Tax=Haloarcula TaxID=2237 RepID=UPI0023E454C4|nr:CARDB domain-containing protein [Halomicroarcula sp. DFY41]